MKVHLIEPFLTDEIVGAVMNAFFKKWEFHEGRSPNAERWTKEVFFRVVRE